MSHRFPPLARWAVSLCATSLVALSLGAFTARGDEPDVGVLGLTPADPATIGVVETDVPGLSDVAPPGAMPSSDLPGFDLLWSTQMPGSPGTPPQLDALGKPILNAALPPHAPPAPRNAIEEAKIARARAAVAAARAGEIDQPAGLAGEVDQRAAQPASTGSVAADGKAPSDAALTLRPDPAAGLITVPPPRQEAGQAVLTDAEKTKLGKGERQ